MNGKTEKLQQILIEMEDKSPVSNSAIISDKGQIMASALHKRVDESAVGAMSAATTQLGSRVAKNLDAGDTDSVVIHGTDNLIMVHNLDDGELITLASADAKVGIIDFEVEKATEKLEKILGE